MSAWRRNAQTQFPQHAGQLERWSLIDWSVELRRELVEAVARSDDTGLRRVFGYLTWCWSQRHTDEQFVHFVADVLRPVLRRSEDRADLFARLDGRTFAAMGEIFRSVCGEEQASEFEQEFHLQRRASG